MVATEVALAAVEGLGLALLVVVKALAAVGSEAFRRSSCSLCMHSAGSDSPQLSRGTISRRQ